MPFRKRSLALLLAVVGCTSLRPLAHAPKSASATTAREKCTEQNDAALAGAGEPLGQEPSRAGGALLRTGAFQLGPGVGKDLMHSQWDGMSGFPVP